MDLSLRVAILTSSDRCSRGEAQDSSGPALAARARAFGWTVAATALLPDDEARLSRAIRGWCDGGRVDLVLTTGGTGVGPRDRTPEATLPLLEKLLPGLPELMRASGLASTRRAALSRAAAGVRGRTLVLNLPGSPRGAVESLESVADLLEHAARMLLGEGHEPPVKVRATPGAARARRPCTVAPRRRRRPAR